MTNQLTRRDMLRTSAAVGAGLWIGSSSEAKDEKSPNEKLNLAFIGIGGRGRDNLRALSREAVNIVALCDVDDKRAGKAYEQHPKAEKFYDFRRLLDKMEKGIDGVVISTPDHTHFHPAMMSMRMGKHCYCEKPMAHSIHEVREMTKLAKEKKVATQLGVQRHTLKNVHRAVELVKSGAIGKVSEVHCWIGGSRGMPSVPRNGLKVPDHLKWDLWLGPRKERAFHSTYAPYGWRFWWDFGTGETGNWGCHILDIPFWALDLKYPTKVKASGPPVHDQTTPKAMSTHFEHGEVNLSWYHAKNGPPILKEKGLKPKGANTLFIGEKGMLLCGFGMTKLLVDGKEVAGGTVKNRIPKSPGFYKEWILACKGGEAATCEFGYSGPLTETVLLGNVAYRAGEEFTWDSENLKTKGSDKAQQLIQEDYRKGWEL